MLLLQEALNAVATAAQSQYVSGRVIVVSKPPIFTADIVAASLPCAPVGHGVMAVASTSQLARHPLVTR